MSVTLLCAQTTCVKFVHCVIREIKYNKLSYISTLSFLHLNLISFIYLISGYLKLLIKMLIFIVINNNCIIVLHIEIFK